MFNKSHIALLETLFIDHYEVLYKKNFIIYVIYEVTRYFER